MLAAIKFSHTKNPRPGSTHTKYAMWDLEDLEGIVRCIMWPEQFAEFGELVKADAILAMRATIDRRPGAEEINLIVNELIPLEELSARFSSGVLIRVREDVHGIDILTPLREIVRGYPGNKPLAAAARPGRRRQRDARLLREERRHDRSGTASPRGRAARPGQLPHHGRRAEANAAATRRQ